MRIVVEQDAGCAAGPHVPPSPSFVAEDRLLSAVFASKTLPVRLVRVVPLPSTPTAPPFEALHEPPAQHVADATTSRRTDYRQGEAVC